MTNLPSLAGKVSALPTDEENRYATEKMTEKRAIPRRGRYYLPAPKEMLIKSCKHDEVLTSLGLSPAIQD